MTNNNDGCTLAHIHQPSSSKKKSSSRFEAPKKNYDENGHVEEGNHNCKNIFKKGPWTPEEDALLIEYVKKHGERHWNSVQKTGLMRCGKSCRLRWTNHLRPDLKKGAFSSEEERIVLGLHAKLGNKWSKIAAELPGRTDNEVKNFWNTKIKRRMKVNESMLNSQGNDPKENTIFHQHLQQQNIQKAQGQIPNSMKNIHSSLIPLVSRTNPNPCENAIRPSEFNDPILSFLNNPAYKYQFLSEEEKGSYDFGLPSMCPNSGLELPQSSYTHSSFLDTGSSNKVFVESPLNPNYSTININSSLQIPSLGIYDSWLLSLMGKNSDINNKPLFFEQEKNILDETHTRDDAGKMGTLLVGHKRLMDNHSVVHRNNGIKRLKVEPLEELIMPMDDDLSSLLHDFSWMSSPTPLYYASNEASIPNHEDTFELPTITSDSLPTTIIPSTSDFKCNMDDYCLTN